MAASNTQAALESAKTALHNADNFGQRETGNKKAGDNAPKPHLQANEPSYSQAAAARKSEPSTTMKEFNERQANADSYLTHNPGGPIK